VRSLENIQVSDLVKVLNELYTSRKLAEGSDQYHPWAAVPATRMASGKANFVYSVWNFHTAIEDKKR